MDVIAETPIPADVTELLVPGEQAIVAFKTFRDSAIFTTHRLIVRDAQGLRGKKGAEGPLLNHQLSRAH